MEYVGSPESKRAARSHVCLWVVCVIMIRLGMAGLSSVAFPALALYLFPPTMFDRPKMTGDMLRYRQSLTPASSATSSPLSSPPSSRSSSRSSSSASPLSPKALFRRFRKK
eukprot:jgi/Tetstr1/463965/TSEL_008770.t1